MVSGACQTASVASALKVIFPGDQIDATMQPLHTDDEGVRRFIEEIRGFDVWIRYIGHHDLTNREDVRSAIAGMQAIDFPIVHFRAFHPDVIGAMSAATGRSIFPNNHSEIVVWAYRNRIARSHVKKLFNRATFDGLGYFDLWEPSVKDLKQTFDWCNLDFSRFFHSIKRTGAFMYTTAHPKMDVLGSLAKEIAFKLGASDSIMELPIAINDAFAGMVTWPVYPAIADHYALPASYTWTINHLTYDLDGFIDFSYQRFKEETSGPEDLVIGPETTHAAWQARVDNVLVSQIGDNS